MTLPPFAWRYDIGYIHPEKETTSEGPPPAAPPTFFCPGGVHTVPGQGGFWGPPPPPGFSGFALPPQLPPPLFYPPPGYGYGGFLPGFGPPPQRGPPSPKKEDKKDDDKTPPEYQLPGGLVPGAVLHYQPGDQVCIHVLGSPKTRLDKILKGDHDGLIDKTIHQLNENTTMEQVLDKLKAGKGGKLTQVHERGAGIFWEGTTFEQGSDKTKDTLKKWGWSGAGLDPKKEPIWVVVQEGEKKC